MLTNRQQHALAYANWNKHLRANLTPHLNELMKTQKKNVGEICETCAKHIALLDELESLINK